MSKKQKALQAILNGQEMAVFRKLNSPTKIQNFLNTLPFNHEKRGETYMSPRRMIKAKTAHCFEGALFAAAALMYHGEKPLLLDLHTTDDDQDHVVALFKQNGMWGAISKTNHNILRFRDPVFKNVREVALSYFNEYFLENGTKTLRSYSDAFDLSKIPLESWFTADEDLIDLVNELNDVPHNQILARGQERKLRSADLIERRALHAVEWKR